MKSLVGFVLLAIVVFIGALLMRLGAFKPVDLRTEEAGPFRVVYQKHTGAYHKIVPVIESVEKWAAQNKGPASEPCQTSFGEYLDDPSAFEEDRLKSNGGCIVKADWSGKLPEGFAYKEIPRRLFVRAAFEGAPSIGPQKVYPRVAQFMIDNGLKQDGAVIEMYERVADSQQIKTHYFFPAIKK